MRSKPMVTYAIAIAIAAVVCYTLDRTKPFAQEMAGAPAMAGGMPGEMMGGAGGPGAGGAGGGGHRYSWVENSMPEELLMTYDEYLAAEGRAPVPLPEVYLVDDSGTIKKATRNMWYCLERVYEDKPINLDRPQVGTPGGRIWKGVYLEAAVKHNEVNSIVSMWQAALVPSNFAFQVGYPRIGPQLLSYDWKRKHVRRADGTIAWERWEATLPDSFTITVPVVMTVKPGCRKNYGQRFYNAMKRFDNRGHGRSPFEVVTFGGGFYEKQTLYLADEAHRVWSDLWSRVQVQLRLFDTEGNEIVRAAQASGLTSGLFTQMLNPPVIHYEPRYRLLLPPDDQGFHGGKLNLEGKEGWYFEFQFTLSREELRSLDDAKARLWTGDTTPQQLKFIGVPSLGGGTTAGGRGPEGGGAMGGPGMGGAMGPGAGAPGMAGAPPGEAGMPPGGAMGMPPG